MSVERARPEDTVHRIKSPTQTCARVLREKLGRKVDSKSVASSRSDRQVVLGQPEKRDDGHSTRSRAKGKACDGPMAQVGETMRFKVACCEMAELESRWVTRACLDRTGEKGEGVVGAAVNSTPHTSPFSRVCAHSHNDVSHDIGSSVGARHLIHVSCA